MEKFFGCSGKMVKPSASTVKSIIKKVQKGELVTIEQIRKNLANDFDVQTACPASITKSLQFLSKEDNSICYWRVVKKKGELISKFPNGVEGRALLLRKEGFEIDFSKENSVVIGFETKLGKLVS